jgi:hypothetical protein
MTPPLNTFALTPFPSTTGWTSRRTPRRPRFRAIGRLRREARDEIDRLIRFLDESENLMELEPEDEGADSKLEDDDPPKNNSPGEWSLDFLERRPDPYGFGRDATGHRERTCQGLGGAIGRTSRRG